MLSDAEVGIPRAVAWLESAPKVDEQYRFLWDAFGDLTTERPSGFGAAAIPFSKIVDYGRFYDLTQREHDQLIGVIRALDRHFLSVMRKRNEAKSAK